MRVKAIGILEKLLGAPVRIPSHRLAAACLLGEIHRGQADFVTAQQHYQLALEEAEQVPAGSHTIPDGVTWYEAYRPRAALGLMLVLRRTLGLPAHIRELAQKTRVGCADLQTRDLDAQLLALEGLLERQLGEIDGALDRLHGAMGRLKDVKGPYLLLSPEHVQALWAQTSLFLPETRFQAAQGARMLLQSGNVGHWTQAVAAATLLHLRISQLQRDEVPVEEVRLALADLSEDAPGGLLRRLERAATREGDPYLLTESLALHAAFAKAAGADPTVFLQRLCDATESLAAPLCLLRAVEAATLFPAQTPGGALPELKRRGQIALERLGAALAPYLVD